MSVQDIVTQHYRSRLKIAFWDHDPNTASAIVTTPDGGTTDRYWDLKDVSRFAVAAVATIFGGASGITKLEIIAASDTSGTDLTVIKDSGTVDADAIGDWLMLECDASEVRHAGEAAGLELRYIAGRITCSNSGDEAIVMYMGDARRPQLDVTPATTIS